MYLSTLLGDDDGAGHRVHDHAPALFQGIQWPRRHGRRPVRRRRPGASTAGCCGVALKTTPRLWCSMHGQQLRVERVVSTRAVITSRNNVRRRA